MCNFLSMNIEVDRNVCCAAEKGISHSKSVRAVTANKVKKCTFGKPADFHSVCTHSFHIVSFCSAFAAIHHFDAMSLAHRISQRSELIFYFPFTGLFFRTVKAIDIAFYSSLSHEKGSITFFFGFVCVYTHFEGICWIESFWRLLKCARNILVGNNLWNLKHLESNQNWYVFVIFTNGSPNSTYFIHSTDSTQKKRWLFFFQPTLLEHFHFIRWHFV